jgi:hypothetical protein
MFISTILKKTDARALPILEEVKSMISDGSSTDEVMKYIMDSMPTRSS